MTAQDKNVETLIESFSDVFASEETEWYQKYYYELKNLYGPDEAFTKAVGQIMKAGHMHLYNVSVEEAPPVIDDYIAKMPQEELVKTVYRDSEIPDDMQKSFDSGEFNAVDVIKAGLDSGDITASLENVNVPAKDEGVDNVTILPDAGLTVAGLADESLDFITAMYVASFSRAPDADGLMYWGERALGLMKDDELDFGAAATVISEHFYNAGQANGESGTELGTADFITTAYHNLLGREPDAGGLDYWVERIDSGDASRDNFLTFFIDAAFASDVDAAQIERLVTTSEYFAQENVSGPNAGISIDRLDAITDIRSDADAAEMILDIIGDYGQPATGDVDLAGLQSVVDNAMIA